MKQKPSSRRRRSSTKSVLRLPDLEHAKAAVLNGLNSADAKRGYCHAKSMSSLTGIARNRAWPSIGSWSCVTALISNPANSPPAPSICVLAPCAGSRTKLPTVVFSAGDLAAGVRRVKGVKRLGIRLGNWLTAEQAIALASARSSATERKTRPSLARIVTRVWVEKA